MPVAHDTPSARRMRGREFAAWGAFVTMLVLGVVLYLQYASRAVPLLDSVSGP